MTRITCGLASVSCVLVVVATLTSSASPSASAKTIWWERTILRGPFTGFAGGPGGDTFFIESLGTKALIVKRSASGKLTTVAGGGTNDRTKDEVVPASSARFLLIGCCSEVDASQLAVDKRGDVFFPESGIGAGERVVEVTTAGMVKTVAGGSVAAGHPLVDGAPATSEPLSGPVAVDSHGNLFVIAPGARVVMKVDPSGTAKVVLGTIGGQVPPFGYTGTALLTHAHSVTTDAAGNLYVADQDPVQRPGSNFTTQRLIKVTPAGRATVILHGLDFAAVAIDKAGHIYAQIDLPQGAMLREFSASGKLLETIAGGKGAYTNNAPARPNFFAANSLVVEPNGNILWMNSQIGLVLLSRRTAKNEPTKQPGTKPSTQTKTSVKQAASKVELDLEKLASGRKQLSVALGGLVSCKLTPAQAGARVREVVQNRVAVLARLRSLPAATSQVVQIKSALVTALSHSIAADNHYLDWTTYLQHQPGCAKARNSDYAAAQHEDTLASRSKQRFVALFDPLARQLGLRSWSASEF